MTAFDLAAFTPPLHVPQLVAPPVVLRPYAVSDLGLVRQASDDPLIPSISSVPRRYTNDAGRAFIERQHARGTEGDGYSFVIASDTEPKTGLGSIGLWLREIESGRASIGYWLVAGAAGRVWRRTHCGPSSRSPSTNCTSRACTSSWSPGTWHRPAPPWPRASTARRRCEDGSASTMRSTMSTALRCSARSGPATVGDSAARPLRDCPGVGRDRHPPRHHLRGIGAGAVRRPIMTVREMGRER